MNLAERLAETALTRPGSDRVRAVTGLARRSARSRADLFLAEGPQCVREALRAHLAGGHGPGPDGSGAPGERPAPDAPRSRRGGVIDALYVTAAALERHPDLAQLIERLLEPDDDGSPRARVFVRLVTDEVLRAMADAETPQGILAVCRIPHPTWTQVVAGDPQLVAVLCRVQDPGNAGTILRAADAAGADAVVLTPGCVDPYHPKVVRSTAGSLFHLPVVTGLEMGALAQAPRLHVLAADGYAALDLDELQDASAAGRPAAFDLARASAWLFGNEAQGLSAAEKDSAEHRIAVPLHGDAESLNVGTAATLCLYASARAQRRRTRPRAGTQAGEQG